MRVASVSLESRHVCGYAQKLREMPARRASHHADPVRIDLVSGRVGPQPADRGLRIEDGGRKLVPGRQAIRDRGRDVAALGQLDAKSVVRLPVARAKAAAVNAQDGRE